MTNFKLQILDGDKIKVKGSETMDPNYLSIAIEGLPIVKTGSDFDFGAVKLTNIAAPTADGHATSKLYVDNALALKLSLAGGTMTGNINMNSNAISGVTTLTASALTLTGGAVDMGGVVVTNVADPTLAQHAATKKYVDDAISNVTGGGGVVLADGSVPFTAAQSMGGFKLTNLANGTNNADAVNFGQLSLYVPLSQKGAALGYADLDSNGKLPVAYLPNSVMELQGFWNASTNTPNLEDGTGNPGDVWEVETAGTHDFGNGDITFSVGDWAVYAADGKWHKSINSNAVVSVNGFMGAVTLNSSHIAENTNLYFTELRAQDAVGAVVANSSKVSLTYVSGVSLTANIVAGSLVNADISGSAAIAYSKLALTGAILNADLAGSIAYSKLLLTGAIVDSDIASGAGIAYSKLALNNAIVANDLTAQAVTNSKVHTNVFDQTTITGGNGVAASVKYTVSKTNDNAGAITVRQIVYVKANGNVDLAQANVANLGDFEIAVVADASIASAASGLVTIRPGAIISGFSGMTPGKRQFVSRSAAGTLVESLSGFVAGESAYSVGRAHSATELVFDPQFEFEFA